MRHSLFALFLFVSLAACGPPAPPNVIILLVDTLRADHLGCYGYERPTSPNIDQLAADSVLFEQVIAPSTFTKTSVASIFTGLEPHRHGVYEADRLKNPSNPATDVLPGDAPTLAEAMRDRGLTTVAWVRNPYLRAAFGFARGFNEYHDKPGNIRKIHASFRAWRAQTDHRIPFFAYFHFLDLHGPNRPRLPYAGLYGHYSDQWASLPSEGFTAKLREIQEGRLAPDAAGVEQLRADYDAVLTMVDAELGSLIETLKHENIYDDALIVFTADHGEAFMEHGVISHSWTPHEELIRVPLLVKLPRSRLAGRRIGEMIRLVDLAPTLIEFVGAAIPRGIDGRSFAPLLRAGGDEWQAPEYAVSEFRGTVGIRTKRWKLIRWESGESVLFDLAVDPLEKRNVSNASPVEAAQLSELATRVSTSRVTQHEQRAPLDSDTREELRALGYLD